MDPFAALGAAAAIAQFVQIGVGLASKAYDTYSSASGMPRADEQLGFVIGELSTVSKSLISEKPALQQTDEEKALAIVAEKCQQLSEKILRILERIKADNPRSKRQSAVAALRSLWNEKEKKELKKDADDCRNLLHLQLTSIMGSETIKRLEDIATSGQASMEALHSLQKHVVVLEQGVRVSSLDKEVQETIANLFRLSTKALDSITSHRILNSLFFQEMHMRYSEVPTAYSETLNWIFEDQAPPKQWKALEGRMLFREWLETGDGIFYISGKPGAGKSTLMKFIFQNRRTKDLLGRWAAGRQLIFCKFFFWKPGSKMQNSVPAMLRTLLYDILQQCPELTQTAFPEYWLHVQSLPWQAPVQLPFDNDQIREAFDRLSRNLNSDTERCLCFLIDGLDELRETPEEKYKDLVALISRWTKQFAGDLKLCVSSREERVFVENLEGPRGFKLQDLTYDDIYHFIDAKLKCNQNFIELEMPEGGRTSLISKVAARADGVFLWVSLVVNLLDDACDDGDDFSELERKIECTQPRVEDLFRQLFDSIHNSDRNRSAQSFAVVLKLLENPHGMRMSLFRFSLLDDFNSNPEFAADIENLKRAGLVGTDWEHVERRLKKARKQLYRRCRGLLEVHTEPEPLIAILDKSRTGYRTSRYTETISLAHREVHQFLLRDDIQKDRNGHIKGFDIFGAICQTFAAEVTSMTFLMSGSTTQSWTLDYHNYLSCVPELIDILRNISQQDSPREQHLMALDNVDVLRYPTSDWTNGRRPDLEVLSPTIAVPWFGGEHFVCHIAAALGIEQYFRYDVQLPARNLATKDGTLLLVLLDMLTRDESTSSATNYPGILRKMLQNTNGWGT
ncbi:predicted protein [Aspergillus terreus NIH2624]|uniref:Uncharacterized protein n=1 Tax=Aspergillus terreus (strain NIH 2624 / FGSC A1156) TaxID=341663 RepID=Q0CBU7_ASPTN|nr:uncharacterized protein ATEG_08837 [Aspergillus terreus NIH2624]EAU30969.1 predicted protein [Aspergillus terreus NIH2624]